MDWGAVYHGLVAIAAVLALSALGVPIGISLGSVALSGLYLTAGPTLALVTL